MLPSISERVSHPIEQKVKGAGEGRRCQASFYTPPLNLSSLMDRQIDGFYLAVPGEGARRGSRGAGARLLALGRSVSSRAREIADYGSWDNR
jgi:hypothetical protein